MLPERVYYELMALKAQADKADEEMDKFQHSFNEFCHKLVTEIYADQLLTMESDGFRDIEDKISRAAAKLTVDINNIVFRNQVKQ